MAQAPVEPLPCPHCGCVSAGIDADLADSGVHQVVCDRCAACGPIVKLDMDVAEGREEQQAFELWNMRVDPAAPSDTDAIERRARAEALRWLAKELDEQAADCQADTMRVIVSSGARSRIKTLTETAAVCRAAALCAELGTLAIRKDPIQ